MGCRPLVLGSRERSGRTEWCVASEDCAFGPIGFQRVRDVAPGEMIVISGAQHSLSRVASTFECMLGPGRPGRVLSTLPSTNAWPGSVRPAMQNPFGMQRVHLCMHSTVRPWLQQKGPLWSSSSFQHLRTCHVCHTHDGPALLLHRHWGLTFMCRWSRDRGAGVAAVCSGPDVPVHL